MEKVGAYTDRVTESGEWRPGNPASGQQATPMLAPYFNMLQRELVNVVEGSEIELDGEDDGQLLKAIKKQAEGVAPVATQAEALVTDEALANNTKRMTPLRVLQAIKARLINASETVVGMLRVGTQAEVNAGALDGVAVTPKTLRHGLLFSFGTNGYFFLPAWLTGFGIQWGSGSIVVGTNAVVAFAMAFPNSCFCVVAGTGSVSGTEAEVASLSWTSSSVTLRADTGGDYRFFAIGR
ncbi:hypothetical protein NDO41_06865 [Ectopseudomonas mendocina]|nr:hypothetical protein NDO41_06865 [Pseudomonas mendocina]